MATTRDNPQSALPIGRYPRDQYMVLPYPVVHSDAWRGLSGRAVRVWIELRSRYNGKNDGQLHLSLEEGARLLHMSKSTVHHAFKELEAKGFVHLVTESPRGGRRAREYAATFPEESVSAAGAVTGVRNLSPTSGCGNYPKDTEHDNEN